MNPGQTRDVVIVGGGPAGSTAALFLRQLGHDVLLLDAAEFPRDKICGEGVSPEAWRLLTAAGAASEVRALDPWPLAGMQVVAPSGQRFSGWYRGRSEHELGFAIRRTRLDATLLAAAQRAGAEVRQSSRVVGLQRAQDRVRGIRLQTGETVGARVVLGCDGRHSIVARELGLLRPHPWFRRFAVRMHFDGVQGLQRHGEMHVGRGGYCGLAPLGPQQANLTFVVPRAAMRGAAGRLESFGLETLHRLWPELAERCAGARLSTAPRAIGPLAVVARRRAVPGALLLGDAAGFYDPFTGEGITLALRSAELATARVDQALRGRESELLLYDRDYHLATRDKFRLNRLLQALVAVPAAADLVTARLARRPSLGDELVGIAGDFVPARRALDWRLLWRLLGPPD